MTDVTITYEPYAEPKRWRSDIGEGKALGCAVRDAPLGVSVFHAPSGFRFTVKEF